MEILLNKCYGGYGLSNEAVRLYLIKKNIEFRLNPKCSTGHFKYYMIEGNDQFSDHNIPRTDPVIIQVVRDLGKKANGRCAELVITSIPDGCEYYIDEYDGMESIETWFELTEQELLNGVSLERLNQLKSATSIRIAS